MKPYLKRPSGLRQVTWLSGFDQRIALSPLFFLAPAIAAAAAAVLTVAGQSLRVARAEPAVALRYE